MLTAQKSSVPSLSVQPTLTEDCKSGIGETRTHWPMGAAKFSSPACPYLLPRALCTSPLCNTLRRPSPKIASPFITFHQHCRERESVLGKGDGLLGPPAMAPTVRQLEPDCNKSVNQQPPKLAYSSSMRRMLACGIFPSPLGPGFSDIICHGGHQGGKGKWREGKVGMTTYNNNNNKHLRCGGDRKGLLGRNDQTHHRMHGSKHSGFTDETTNQAVLIPKHVSRQDRAHDQEHHPLLGHRLQWHGKQ